MTTEYQLAVGPAGPGDVGAFRLLVAIFGTAGGDDVQTPLVAAAVAQAGDLEPLRRGLAQALAALTPREREVLRLRFGLDAPGEPLTLEEASMRLGVTRERVRQIVEKALRKLRHPSRVTLLRGYVVWIRSVAAYVEAERIRITRAQEHELQALRAQVAELSHLVTARTTYDRALSPVLRQNTAHIATLELPPRLFNALMRAGITRVCDLAHCSEEDLLALRNVGETSVMVLTARLQALLDAAGATDPPFSFLSEEVAEREDAAGRLPDLGPPGDPLVVDDYEHAKTPYGMTQWERQARAPGRAHTGAC